MKKYKLDQNRFVFIPIQIALFLMGAYLSYKGLNLYSAISFGGLVLCSILFYYNSYKTFFHPLIIYSLSLIGGISLSCLKLSRLSKKWEIETWGCLLIAYFVFIISYLVFEKINSKKLLLKTNNNGIIRHSRYNYDKNRHLLIIVITTVVSLLCMVFEWIWCGFLPILSDKPHAYSYFHVSGVHYFTILFTLVPAMSVIYIMAVGGDEKKALFKCIRALNIKEKLILAISNIIAIAIPILIVSRFQLIFEILVAMFAYLYLNENFKLRYIVIIVFVLAAGWAVLTVFRHHSAGYLNKIFEFKNKKTPLFITQPYTYICNNFENFNLLVKNMGIHGINKTVHHTYGLKMLFPFIALSGLKFKFPNLVSDILFINKAELTTRTMFYDSYIDFGIWGVFLLVCILGIASYKINAIAKTNKNPLIILLASLLTLYLTLAFFDTWFSNPTTWFYFAVILIIYIMTKSREIKL